MRITRDIKINLTDREQFEVVRNWVKSNPEIVRVLLSNPGANCPFPFECNEFPCETLSCQANSLVNGNPFRS